MRNDDFFLKVFENSPIPTVILAGEFPVLFVNEANSAYASITGRTRDELKGNPFFITTPHPAMHFDIGVLEDIKQSIEKVYLDKTITKTPLQQFLKPIRESGEFETLYLEATNTPVFNAEGDIDFIMRTIQNVTDAVLTAEKEKEKSIQLTDNEKFLSDTQKVAQIGSWEMDKNNRFNWSDILYEIMEVERGKDITVDFGIGLLKRQQDKDVFAEVYKNAVENGTQFDVELNLTTPKGNQRWIRFTGKGELKDGEFVRMYGTGQDITISKRISELERVEKTVLELNASPSASTKDVLKSYLEGIESIFPEMQCAIMQERNGLLHNWAANSLPAEYLEAIDQLPIRDNTGSCGTAAFKNETIIVSDISTDTRWQDYKDVALRHGLNSCWSRPISNKSGDVIATLAMYYKTARSPTEEELNVVDRMAYLLQVILQHRNDLELLEEANLLMEQSQEIAHFGSVQYDVSTRELTWSKELYNIFGLDRKTKPTVELYYAALHPDDKDRIIAIIQNALQTKDDFVTEERIIRPSGEVRSLKSWGRVKSNESGEVVKVISTYLDITESKKTREDLVASESRLRSLVDSQTNYVIRIDINENYSYVNKKYMEDFGPTTGESLLGTNSITAMDASQRLKVEDVRQKCITHPNEVFELELEKYSNDGRIKSTFWHFVCLTDSKGKPREIQCIGIDISDLKEAENEREKKAIELEKSEKKYSDLFQLSPQPMWVYDPESLIFLDVNKAALEQYGYSREEFLAMTIRDIQPDDHSLKSDPNQKDFYRGIFTHKLKNGELITVDTKLTEIPFRDKIANLSFAINITEPIQYLEALEKQNALLSEIAWIQSHAVRAPLTRIIGLVDILKNHEINDKEQSFVLDGIISSASDLDVIVGDIVRKAEQITIIPDKPLE